MASLTNEELTALLINHIANCNGSGGSEGSGGEGPSTDMSAYDKMLEAWTNNVQAIANYCGTYDIITDNREMVPTVANALMCYAQAITNYLTNTVAPAVGSILSADDISTISLNAVTANIDTLCAGYIKANDIATGTLRVDQLFSLVGEFFTLIAENLTAEGIQAFNITSDHLTIKDAFIKSAMIESINASKITNGELDTALVKVKGASGNMEIADGLIKISDGTYVRVAVGKYGETGDYTLTVWDANGKVMWSATGITADAIKDAIIVDDMISDNANISPNKINIAALITTINEDGGLTVKSSNVTIDAEGQSLDVWFQTMTSWQNDYASRTQTLETNVSLIQGQLSSFIKASDIEQLENDVTTLKDEYTSLSQTSSEITAELSSMKSTVESQSTKVDELNTTVESYDTKIQANTAAITVSQQSAYTSQEQVDNTIANYTSQFQATASTIELSIRESLKSDYVSRSEFERWFKLSTDGLIIGSYNPHIMPRMSNEGIVFYYMSGETEVEIGSWDGDMFHARNLMIDVNYKAQFGNYAWIPRPNGALILTKAGNL